MTEPEEWELTPQPGGSPEEGTEKAPDKTEEETPDE